MKRSFLSFAFLTFALIAFPALAQRRAKLPCEQKARTQIEMNKCADQALQKAEADLDNSYRQLLSALSNLGEQKLQEAQSAWLNYKAAACESESALNAGGSLQALARNYCLAAITQERTKRLKVMMKALGNTGRGGGDQAPGSESASSRRAFVSGNVFFFERLALPPDAIVSVKLIDVSRQDAPAQVLGEQTIKTDGRQPPFDFEIPYDSRSIIANRTYTVQARITVDNELWFTSVTSYPVITNGHPEKVAVRVNRAKAIK